MSNFIKGLYLVATPIGNLGDISARAIDVLTNADLIACEDTRVTAKLLTLLGIKKVPLTPYHEHNADKVRPELIKKLQEGAMIALVSDAGTPLVNDPGYKFVQDCIQNDIYMTSVPGASAVLTALQVSGLPCHRFLYAGFLPTKTVARQKEAATLATVPATLIFYESPNRVLDALKDLQMVLGNRQAAVARELTKKFEQTVRGSLLELIKYYEENGQPKGELVILVAPCEKNEEISPEMLEQNVLKALESLSLKDAVAFVADQTGVAKKTVYQKALEIKNAKS